MEKDMQIDQANLTPGGRHFLEAMDKNSLVIAASEFNGMNSKDKSLNSTLH
jgi:hypothetical protein